MNTPQEQIAEYLQKHYSGGEGWPPMHHAAEICKLFSPTIAEMEDRIKTAASMLRSAVYERTPLGDKWIDHFDIERQKAITEFLAGVEGKP